MNLELKRRYGDYLRETLPLHKVGDIRCGNALRLDWNEILPHEKDDEVYLFGNPPYKGHGGMSFAMNVAEILRVLRLLQNIQQDE